MLRLFARRTVRLPHYLGRSLASSANDSSRAATPTAPASTEPPNIPIATTAFKVANPEANMSTQSRMSWYITGGVVACSISYYLYLLYNEQHELEEYRASPKPEEVPLAQQVEKVLPNGRVLMKDGSIVSRGK
jgi:hypothetical protein